MKSGTFNPGAQEGTVSDEERGKLLEAVNMITTNYGLKEREAHCLAAGAHVLVSNLRPN